MGRLPQKKTSSKKKKKKVAASKSAAATVEQKSRASAVTVKDNIIGRALSQKKSSGTAKASQRKIKQNFLGKAIQFLREVKVELKKVTWPSRKQTVGSTVVVILLVMIISFFLGIVDIGLSSLVRVVLQ
jgi:preprotein translocase subunit SecE